MPTLRERWNNLTNAIQLIIVGSVIGLIILSPIDILILPINLCGVAFVFVVVGVGWLLLGFINLLAYILVYILLGIFHLLLNAIIFIINLIVGAINTLAGSTVVSVIGYVDLMANLPSTVFFLYDPDLLLSMYIWTDISLSGDSILWHLLGWA